MKSYLSDRKRIFLIGFLVMLATSIPYLLGYACQGDEWRFTGFLIGVEDGNSYIAKMLSGAEGDWLFRSPYSAEPQAGVMAFLPYLVLGKLSSGSAQHEQLVALFHAARFVGGILVTLAIYDFISLFIEDEKRRRLALVVILVGGGLGWIMAAAGLKDFLGSVPLDFISPESFGFLGLFGLPHLVIARAFLFWGITLYLKKGSGVITGLLWLSVGVFQPMYVIIIWVVVGFHSILEFAHCRIKKLGWDFSSSYMKKALIAGIISCPLVIYTAVVFISDPYLRAWTAQNYLPSPHWGHYLLAYGLVLPLAVWGVVKLSRAKPMLGLFMACWLVSYPVLVYAPVNTQRRLAEGIWVILITGMFLYFIDMERLPIYGKIMLGMLFPTSIFLLWGAGSRAIQPSPPIFIPRFEVQAYQAVRKLAPKDSVVLSSFETGNSLPAWAPIKVIQGHGPETIHLEDWQLAIETYFSNNKSKSDCGDFLFENGIDYLVWGPREAGQWDWMPEIKNCLNLIYDIEGYRVYQVED